MSRASEITNLLEGIDDTLGGIVRGTLGPATDIIPKSEPEDPIKDHSDSVVDHVSKIVPLVTTAAKLL